MTKYSDVKFPGAEQYPNWLIFAAMGVAAPLYMLFTFFDGDPSRGLASAFSGAVLVSNIIILWNMRRKWQFWLSILVSITFHVCIVLNISGFDTHFPAVILMPVFLIDLLLWQFITVAIIRYISR